MSAARWTLATTLLAALAVVFGPACGGGGGGGGGGGAPTPPQPGITFTGASASAPAIRLARGPGSTATVLELEVRADEVQPVYGVAFDLSYPEALLRFDGFGEGMFLAAGGAQTSVQVARTEPGRLVVGATRLGDVPAAGGSGMILRLRFNAAGPGGGQLAFSQNRVFDSRGDQVPGVAWAGGTVQVTQ